MSLTRAEHVKWCKQRAREEFKYYLVHENIEAAIRNGIASMASDLRKHKDTENLVQTAILVGMTIKDVNSFNKFVDGFAE